ncbi:hypothetical protein AJ79_05506 [Helicocarpus griseus UAMH5409]|uniref:FAD linked oxidase N-terminal domain-containing protein n=1 Tax=Helicocarpus griseus UAMH5409 TaxID=1447875 RepID=A0A2B7XN01_9EURO|nr:hypothetical protein AJ79_05506 [Helicocarpus griseus UAMH5409]
MASLSSALVAVLEGLSGFQASSQYRETILTNANELNGIFQPKDVDRSKGRAVMACEASRILFQDNAVVPQDPTYQEMKEKIWTEGNWQSAACFLKAQNTIEVTFALKIVTYFRANFAIRSGGHNPNVGFSSVGDHGVVIDLGALNAISLSKNRDVASIRPGAVWDKVYEEMNKREVAVVGGRIPGVGVGDSLLAVVLGDSSVVQANATENPDLFRSLKGGGPNFGKKIHSPLEIEIGN